MVEEGDEGAVTPSAMASARASWNSAFSKKPEEEQPLSVSRARNSFTVNPSALRSDKAAATRDDRSLPEEEEEVEVVVEEVEVDEEDEDDAGGGGDFSRGGGFSRALITACFSESLSNSPSVEAPTSTSSFLSSLAVMSSTAGVAAKSLRGRCLWCIKGPRGLCLWCIKGPRNARAPWETASTRRQNRSSTMLIEGADCVTWRKNK